MPTSDNSQNPHPEAGPAPPPEGMRALFQPESELTVPDSVKGEQSFTLQDFEAALIENGPSDDATVEVIAATIRRWNGILIHVGKRKTALAWRIGKALVQARNKVAHGQWYPYLKRELEDLSKPTIWRYMQLYIRSPQGPPVSPLTDAYVDLGVCSNGNNTVQEYLRQLGFWVSKAWKLRRAVKGLNQARADLLNHIDWQDFSDADGAELLAHEAGANYALKLLIQEIDSNPELNIFTKYQDEIAAGPAVLEVIDRIGKGLRSPFDEHGGDLIPADCIPQQLMDPEAVAEWEAEHRAEVSERIKREQRDRARQARSYMRDSKIEF